MLEIDRLSAGYDGVVVVREVSLRVGEGEIVALLGANGAGKSTILGAISNMVRRFAGSVRFAGEALETVRPADLITRKLVHVPEGKHLFASMSVRENLDLGAFRFGAAQRGAAIERVFALFPRLAERAGQMAGTLSGGEQQMVAIGRALMAEPRLLMLDEPSQGLAPKIVGELFRAIQRINESGVAILLVEQNVRRTLKIAQRGYVLENGRIALSGTTAELADDDRVRKSYLGL